VRWRFQAADEAHKDVWVRIRHDYPAYICPGCRTTFKKWNHILGARHYSLLWTMDDKKSVPVYHNPSYSFLGHFSGHLKVSACPAHRPPCQRPFRNSG